MNENVAKDFLLEEYRAFSQSLSESEKIGETRVNWFIGIVTAGVGGLVKILADDKIHGWPLRIIIAAGLIGLLAFGYVTFWRIVKRNKRTDELIAALDRIRKIFRDHFKEPLLAQYAPFQKRRGDDRAFGGLADLVLTINSLLAAALAAPLMPARTSPIGIRLVLQGIAACSLAPAIFVWAFCLQRRWLKPTHAGGVVYRVGPAELEYLLVGPSKDEPNVWVLPKGHIKRGESPEHTAGREVREETGVVAEIRSSLGTVEFTAVRKTIWATFYLMRFVSQDKPSETRRCAWFSTPEALANATHPETKALLEKAIALLNQSSSKS
jgi:ADP-ribose pyrophosphatase YjhB (NUDIX family)